MSIFYQIGNNLARIVALFDNEINGSALWWAVIFVVAMRLGENLAQNFVQIDGNTALI